jgi:hypothetical protein
MSGIAQPNRADEVQSVSQLRIAMIYDPAALLIRCSNTNTTTLLSF